MPSTCVLVKLFETAGVLTLNKKSHNLINREMLSKIHLGLTNLENRKCLVILKSSLRTTFCAGADLRELLDFHKRGDDTLIREQLNLYYKIHTYRLPLIALINGLTMGVGLGLSMFSKYRVATERTVIVMPEVAVGFFPGPGGAHLFNRMVDELGMYLGLTNNSIKGRDVLLSGLATHYCDSKRIDDLETALLTCSSTAEVESILDEFCPVDEGNSTNWDIPLQKINECFGANNVEEIFANLKNDNSTWAKQTLKNMNAASPLSIKLSHHIILATRNVNLTEAFKIEFRVFVRLLVNSDFIEGVRANIIDKDNNPKWMHSNVTEVPKNTILEYFEPFKNQSREFTIFPDPVCSKL